MPPEGQTQKDIPLKEDSNTSPVDDDLKTSSLSQMQTAVLLLTQLVGQQKLPVPQGSYAPRGIAIPEPSSIPIFTGPLHDASAVLLHTDLLYRLLRTYSLLTPQRNDVQEENRRVTVLELANNSIIECSALMPWLETTGRMMEEDGESGWDEWLIAFKDATMPFEWAITEQRSLYRLPFTQVCDWSTFDHQAIQHRRLLMGTDFYPSDKQMAVLYRAACPEILFINLMTRPDFKSGTWSEVRTLLQMEVGMYMERQKYTFAPTHAKVQIPPNQPHLAHPINHYYDHRHSLPHYLSPAGRHIRDVFSKENRCNDCRQVGHSYKTCPNRRPSTRSFPRLADNHKVMV